MSKRKTFNVMAVAAAALGLGIAAVQTVGNSAQATDATGTASATIAQPIAVTESTYLNFGAVSVSATAGTVVIGTTGTRTVTGGVTAFGGQPSAATFAVTGESGAAYSITLPTSAALSSGGNTLTISGFTTDAGASPTIVGGATSFNVGATLDVAANQTPGAYSGTYTVNVNYN